MSPLKNNRNAQMSMYDSILFFIIICIASGILIHSVQKPSDVEEIIADNTLIRYTEEAFAAIVESTCYRVSYEQYEEDKNNPGEVKKTRITLENRSVPYLLLFDVDARDRLRALHNSDPTLFDENTVEDAIYSLEEGIEKHVNDLMDRMIGDQYYYILDVSYHGSDVLDLRDSRLRISFQPSEPTTSKGSFGGLPKDVVKCPNPNCGALIPKELAACPECDEPLDDDVDIWLFCLSIWRV